MTKNNEMESSVAGAKQYNKLISKRKKIWQKLFEKYEHTQNSEEILVSDLPYVPTGAVSSNGARRDSEECPADDLENVSDPNNEDFDDISEAESEDTAKFSDSDEESLLTVPQQVKHIISNYASDSEDDELSSDLDDSNDSHPNEDFLDRYLEQMRQSRIHHLRRDLEGFASDGSDEEEDEDDDDDDEDDADDSFKNSSTEGTRTPLIMLNNNDVFNGARDENRPEINKRTFSETDMEDEDTNTQLVKRPATSQLKTVNIYINSNENEFENDD